MNHSLSTAMVKIEISFSSVVFVGPVVRQPRFISNKMTKKANFLSKSNRPMISIEDWFNPMNFNWLPSPVVRMVSWNLSKY